MADSLNEDGGGSGPVPVPVPVPVAPTAASTSSSTAGGEYYKYVFGATIAALKHDPGLSSNWSPEEIPLIHHLFIKYSSESIVTKYAKIAQHLNDKTTRDVILYHKTLIQNMQPYNCQPQYQYCNTENIAQNKENRKRRKNDDNSSRKNKDKKEEFVDPLAKSSSHLTNGHPYAQTEVSMDSDDDISYKAIGGATGRLLEQNAQAMDQISANFRAYKIHDNIDLFCHARKNILSLLKDLNDVPEVMKKMPPFPVKLNEELSSYLLPSPSWHKKS